GARIRSLFRVPLLPRGRKPSLFSAGPYFYRHAGGVHPHPRAYLYDTCAVRRGDSRAPRRIRFSAARAIHRPGIVKSHSGYRASRGIYLRNPVVALATGAGYFSGCGNVRYLFASRGARRMDRDSGHRAEPTAHWATGWWPYPVLDGGRET